jgi:hypothetical protein
MTGVSNTTSNRNSRRRNFRWVPSVHTLAFTKVMLTIQNILLHGPMTDGAHRRYPSADARYCCKTCRTVVPNAAKEVKRATREIQSEGFWPKPPLVYPDV